MKAIILTTSFFLLGIYVGADYADKLIGKIGYEFGKNEGFEAGYSDGVKAANSTINGVESK